MKYKGMFDVRCIQAPGSSHIGFVAVALITLMEYNALVGRYDRISIDITSHWTPRLHSLH